MVHKVFKITQYKVSIGSKIGSQRIYSSPQGGDITMKLCASIVCTGTDGEFEIVFPSYRSWLRRLMAPSLTNLAGSGPPVWGLIVASPDQYPWYLDLLRNEKDLYAWVDIDKPEMNKIYCNEANTGWGHFEPSVQG